MSLLERPFGYSRSPQQIARNLEAIELLQHGKLQRGELFRLVTGVSSPRAAVDMAEPGPGRPASLTDSRRKGPPGVCIDCREPVGHAGEPLKSQPRRCLDCGRKRRQQHNGTLQEAAEATA